MNYAQPRRASRNLTGISIVVVLHIALVYLLVTGLGRQAIEVLKGPIETKIIKEEKPPEDLPPPPPPTLLPPPPPYIPPPEIQIQVPAAPTNAIAVTTSVKPVAPPPPMQATPDRPVSARPISGPPLEYPPRMLAAGREGSVNAECTIEADGSTNNCVVVNSVGGSVFADAALSFFKTHKYAPAVRNGVAVREEHHALQIIFSLH
jgi:protein TonB